MPSFYSARGRRSPSPPHHHYLSWNARSSYRKMGDGATPLPKKYRQRL
ncbi:MAG: hypothetical protein F6K30_26675 [Cyanothece sp. SIO2G6]|nr:hypothetical protein [Cyanothece sp. SIO2G6]